jgi:hypothetical protein
MSSPEYREKPEAVVELDSGITIKGKAELALDWKGIRTLVESGLPVAEVARHYKVLPQVIDKRRRAERWLTPARVESMRREIERHQTEVFARSGRALGPEEVKARVWDERSERWKERLAAIVDETLDSVDSERASGMVREIKDLKGVLEIARTLTGEQAQEDKAAAQQVAVNIGFLRSARPIQMSTDVIDVE